MVDSKIIINLTTKIMEAKTLEIENLGLTSMTYSELQELDGGWWKEVLFSLIDNWSDFTDGIRAGYAEGVK